MEADELRYSDGPSTEADLWVDAAPADVWLIVSDIGVPARFSGELQGVEWLDGATSATVGARFVGRNHHDAAGTWETTCTVTECAEPSLFGYVVGEPEGPSAAWRFTLHPEDGGTRLTQWMRMGPARSGINPAIDAMPDKESKILRRRLAEHRANMEATLHGIKGLAEA